MASAKKKLTDTLFVDIETAGTVARFDDLPVALQKLWLIKARQISRGKDLDTYECAELYAKKAGIYSEFAQVVCVSVGYFQVKKGKISGFRCKSFYGEEVDILRNLITLLKEHFDQPKQQAICGHNIKEFDIPFLCRRMVIHKLKVPKMLDISGKKPWEVDHLVDTLHLWRFGDYKNYTSLALLAVILDVPTPKDDIDGSQVHATYWKEQDIERIVRYCEKDVMTVAKVFLRLKRIPYEEDIVVQSRTTFV
jgi:uncharacterized protein YprB with RNaseH-like and TPR domain